MRDNPGDECSFVYFIQKPGIEVTTSKGILERFIDGDTKHMVFIGHGQLDGVSRLAGRGVAHRTVYRGQTQHDYLFDIEQTGGKWFIYRVWD